MTKLVLINKSFEPPGNTAVRFQPDTPLSGWSAMLLKVMKNGETQRVLGVAVHKTDMPELFRLAQADAGTLELVLRGIMRKRGYVRPLQAMILLEADLSYKTPPNGI